LGHAGRKAFLSVETDPEELKKAFSKGIYAYENV
jgi:hypothetical protein